jgi:hypothetical protein
MSGALLRVCAVSLFALPAVSCGGEETRDPVVLHAGRLRVRI